MPKQLCPGLGHGLSRPMKVSFGILHEGISRISFKSCKLQGGGSWVWLAFPAHPTDVWLTYDLGSFKGNVLNSFSHFNFSWTYLNYCRTLYHAEKGATPIRAYHCHKGVYLDFMCQSNIQDFTAQYCLEHHTAFSGLPFSRSAFWCHIIPQQTALCSDACQW